MHKLERLFTLVSIIWILSMVAGVVMLGCTIGSIIIIECGGEGLVWAPYILILCLLVYIITDYTRKEMRRIGRKRKRRGSCYRRKRGRRSFD